MTDNQLCADRAAGNAGVSCACRQGSAGGCWRGPGRATRMRRRSGGERSKAKRSARKAVARFATALVGSALALGGCRTDSTFEFKADGSQYTEIVFEDDTNSMRTLEQTCEDLREYFGTTSRYAAAAKMEDITSPGGHLRCKATSNVPHDEVTVKDDGDTFSISMKSSPPDGADLDGLTMTTTITMPGKVIKSSIGKVRGNKVVIDGTGYLTDGFQITSEANGTSSSPSRSAGTRTDSSNEAAGRHSAKKGPPLWIWVVVGTGILFGLVGVNAAFTRRKRVKTNRATTGFN